MKKKIKSVIVGSSMLSTTFLPSVVSISSAANKEGEIPYQKVNVKTFKDNLSESLNEYSFLTIDRAKSTDPDKPSKVEVLGITNTSHGSPRIANNVPQALNTNYPEDKDAAANSENTGGFTTLGPMPDYELKQLKGEKDLSNPVYFNHNGFMMNESLFESTVYPKFRGGRRGTNVLIPKELYNDNPNMKIRVTYPAGAKMKELYAFDKSKMTHGDEYSLRDTNVDVEVTYSEFIYLKEPSTDYNGLFMSISNDPLSGARPKNMEAYSVEYRFLKDGKPIDPSRVLGLTKEVEEKNPELAKGRLFLTFGSLNYYGFAAESAGLISPTNDARAYLSSNSNVTATTLKSQTQDPKFDLKNTIQTKWNSKYQGMKVFSSKDNSFVDNLMSSDYEKNAVTFSMSGANSYKIRLFTNQTVPIGEKYTWTNGKQYTNDRRFGNGWQFPITAPIFYRDSKITGPNSGKNGYNINPYKPIKTVIDSDENMTNEHWMDKKAGDDTFEYVIRQKVHSVPGEQSKYYDSFVLSDTLPKEVDYISSQLYLDGKEFRTSTLNYNNSSRTVSWTPGREELGYTEKRMIPDNNTGEPKEKEVSVPGTMPMQGETYTLRIKVRLNDKAKKAFTNTASAIFNNDEPISSDTAITHPEPAPKIDIKKQVITPQGTNKTETTTVQDNTRDTIIGAENEYRLYVKLPRDIKNYNKLQIEDVLSDQLDLVDGSIKAYQTQGETINETNSRRYNAIQTRVEQEGEHKKLVINAEDKATLGENGDLNGLRYDYLTITFKAKLNDSTVPDAKVPNKARVVFDSLTGAGGSKESNTVFVFSERAGDPAIRKDVEGQETYFAEKAGKMFNYHLTTALPKNAHKYEKLVIKDNIDPRLVLGLDNSGNVNAKVKLKGNDGLVDFNDYSIDYNKETRALELRVNNFRPLENKSELQITLPASVSDSVKTDERIPNEAKVLYKSPNAIEKERKSNSTKVYINPSDEPTIDKTVNNDKTVDKVAIGKKYEYHITSNLPTNIETYKEFALIDNLNEKIDYINNSAVVKIDGKEMTDNTFRVSYDENTRQLKIAATDFANLQGKKKVEVVFNTKLNQKARNLAPIENVAKVEFKNSTMERKKEKTSPTPVTVTPTPLNEKITVSKKINGDKDKITTKLGEVFTYNITMDLPSDIDLYKEFNFRDKLDSRIDYVKFNEIKADGVTIFRDNNEPDDRKDIVEDSANPVMFNRESRTLGFNVPANKIKNLKGVKKLELSFKAKANTVDVEIPNVAIVSATNPISVPADYPSNRVRVDVAGGNNKEFAPKKLVNEREEVTVNRGDTFTYKLSSKLPEDIAEYKTLEFTDTLNENLVLVNKDKIEVRSDGQLVNKADYDVVTEGRLVKIVFKNIPNLHKNIEVTMNAKISDSYKLSDKIPNNFDINFVSKKSTEKQKITSNTVNVIPSNKVSDANKPTDKEFDLVKKVNGKSAIAGKVGETISYTLDTKLPTNISKYKELIISDPLDSRLDFVNKDIVVRADGKEMPKGAYDIEFKGKELRVRFGDTSLLNKEVTVEFKAKLITDLKGSEKVPNVYHIEYIDPDNNPKKQISSNEVNLTHPEPDRDLGDSSRNFNPVKRVNGKEKITAKAGEAFVYRLQTTLPKDINKYKEFKFTDTLDSRLELADKNYTVKTDGKEMPKGAYDIDVNGKLITVKFKNLESLGGEVYVEFNAKLSQNLKASEQVPNKYEIVYRDNDGNPEKTLNSNEVLVEAPKTPDSDAAKPVDNGVGSINGKQRGNGNGNGGINPVPSTNGNGNGSGNGDGPLKGEQVKTGDTNKKAIVGAGVALIGVAVGAGVIVQNKKKGKKN